MKQAQPPIIASGRIFGINEFAELILLEVDAIQLCALQQINSQFRDIIAKSNDLRKRMLLDPDHEAETDEAGKILRDVSVKCALL